MRTGGGPVEWLDAKYQTVPYTRGKGLEIARGPWKSFPHFISVRERTDTTMPPNVTPDYACDTFADGMAEFEAGSMDFVYVRGIHLDDAIRAEAKRLLKDQGHCVEVSDGVEPGIDPYTVYVKDRGYGRDELVLSPRINVFSKQKRACVVRYGAIGDTMQSASLLPELKRQGYHVTFMCEPVGRDLLRHDPNIDAFWIQDNNQVPNLELGLYWKSVFKLYDRFINLCETVEGTLLTIPGRANHAWPDSVRRKYCGHNYLEFMHEVAELPFHAEHKFYTTTKEEDFARDFRAKIKATVNQGTPPMGRSVEPFLIMWALAGSSVHKFYPHQDAVIAQIMLEIPHAHVIFVGDAACKLLEQGWEKEPRVHMLSGELKLRDSLALAKVCDLVIGPETGVLNAMAFESMAKIVFLSHSSAENLTKHWHNTEALHSTVTPCYPCHRMHYSREFCPENQETGAAMCQYELPPSDVWMAVQRAYVGWSTIRNLLRAA